MSVNLARARYTHWAGTAPLITPDHRSQHRFWLRVEALSLDLDLAVASQFAEFRPSARLTTPPREGAA